MRTFRVVAVFGAMALGAFAAGRVFDVRDFGAVGDGARKDTAAIQKAVDACAKAGGGTVLVPPGRYLTGAIDLRSRVALEIDAGATLLASPDAMDYPLRESPWGDGHKELSALIYGADLEQVALGGRGTIDGQGQVWWKRHWLANPRKGMPKPSAPAEVAEAKAVEHGRPHLIKIVRSEHILIEGLTLINSPSWTVHPILSEFVRVQGITMFYQGSDTNEQTIPAGEGTPRFRDILINNVTARGSKTAGQITGLKEMPIEGITFSNVRIAAQKGFTIQYAKDIAFYNTEIAATGGPALIGRFVNGLLLERFAGVTELREVVRN
ncbi:MAG: hypothetical protein HY822_01020 [Acidobacteria bacterium]|nr:hypothetical protein [Acidobacteriota bacterium]